MLLLRSCYRVSRSCCPRVVNQGWQRRSLWPYLSARPSCHCLSGNPGFQTRAKADHFPDTSGGRMGAENQDPLTKPLLSSAEQQGTQPSMLTAKAYYFLSASAGVFLFPYVTLYLNDLGVNLQQIGILGALRPWLGVAATIAGPLLADHWNCHRSILLACFVLSTTLRASMWLTDDVALVCALLLLADLTLGPVGPMVDSMVLSRCTSDSDYGKQRLFGSVGWGLLAPVAGMLIGAYGLGAGFLAYTACSVPAVIAIYRLAGQPSKATFSPTFCHPVMEEETQGSAGRTETGGQAAGAAQEQQADTGVWADQLVPRIESAPATYDSVMLLQEGSAGHLGQERVDSQLRRRRRARGTDGSSQPTEGDATPDVLSPVKLRDTCSTGSRGFRVTSDFELRRLTGDSSLRGDTTGSWCGAEGDQAQGHVLDISSAQQSPRANELQGDADLGPGPRWSPDRTPHMAVVQIHTVPGTVVATDDILQAAQNLLHPPTTPLIAPATHSAFNANPLRQPLPQPDAAASPTAALGRLLRQPQVQQLLLQCLAGGMGAGLVGNFNFLYARDLGADATTMGLMLSSNCLAETPVFALQGRIMAHMTPAAMLHMSLAAMVLRLMLYGGLSVASAHPWVILPIELLQGLTLGLGWSAICVLSKRLAPPTLQTSLQGVATAVFVGLGGGLGALLGGVMLDIGWSWAQLWTTSALTVAMIWSASLAL